MAKLLNKLVSDLFWMGANEKLLGFIALTYSFDGKLFKKQILPKLNIYSRNDISRLEFFHVITHQSGVASSHPWFYDRIKLFRPNLRSAFHPKLYILKYQKEKKIIYRLMVGSFNLSRAGFSTNFELVYSKDFSGIGECKNNIDHFLRIVYRKSPLKVHLPKKLNFKLDRNTEFIFQGSGESIYKKIFSSFDKNRILEMHIISPFWDKHAVKHLSNELKGISCKKNFYCNLKDDCASILSCLENTNDVKAYFNSFCFKDFGSEADMESEMINKSSLNEDSKVVSEYNAAARGRRFNHAKVIFIKCKGSYPSKLFIGSSNFTQKGLGLATNSNYECGMLIHNVNFGFNQIIDLKKPIYGFPVYEQFKGGSQETSKLTGEDQGYFIDQIMNAIRISNLKVLEDKVTFLVMIDKEGFSLDKVKVLIEGKKVRRLPYRNSVEIAITKSQRGLKVDIYSKRRWYSREIPLDYNEDDIEKIDIKNKGIDSPDDIFDLDNPYGSEGDGNNLNDNDKSLEISKIRRFPFQSLMKIIFSGNEYSSENLREFCNRMHNYLERKNGPKEFYEFYGMEKANFLDLLLFIRENIKATPGSQTLCRLINKVRSC